jgi:hypothetical protein
VGAGKGFLIPASPASAISGGQVIDTTLAYGLAVDINVVALTGGTAPGVIFTLSRVGFDGIYYPFWSSASVVAAGVISASFSDRMSSDYAAGTNNLQGILLGYATAFTWASTGAPTSLTFSANVTVRS